MVGNTYRNCEPEGRRGGWRYWSIGFLAVDSLWSVLSFVHCPIGPPNCPQLRQGITTCTYDTELVELPPSHSLSVTLSHTARVCFSGCHRPPISCHSNINSTNTYEMYERSTVSTQSCPPPPFPLRPPSDLPASSTPPLAQSLFSIHSRLLHIFLLH